MSLDRIIKEAWKEYSQNFMAILVFVLLFFALPVFVMGIVAGAILLSMMLASNISIEALSNNFIEEVSGILLAKLGIALGIFLIVYLVILLFNYAAFYGLPIKKRKYTWKDLYKTAKTSFWRYFGRSILLFLLLFILFMLLIIPGIIFGVFWIFSIYIWFNEQGKSFSYSLKKSKQLVKGKWWKTFLYILLISVSYLVFYFLASNVPFIGFVLVFLGQVFVIYFIRHIYVEFSKK